MGTAIAIHKPDIKRELTRNHKPQPHTIRTWMGMNENEMIIK